MEKPDKQKEFLNSYIGYARGLNLRILTRFCNNAILHKYCICYGGKKLLVLYDWLYSKVFSILSGLITVAPFIGRYSDSVHKKISSKVNCPTFKDFQKSRKDFTTIFLGMEVEPIIERLNFLMESLVNNYILMFQIAIFCLLNNLVKLHSDLGHLFQFFVIVDCLVTLSYFTTAIKGSYCCRHFSGLIYNLGLIVFDVTLFELVSSLQFNFSIELFFEFIVNCVFLAIFIFVWVMASAILWLSASANDYFYVRKTCIAIDLKHIWNSDSYRMKITINGISFDAKIGFFYLDFRKDAVYFKRDNEPVVTLDYSIIDSLEILGDDIYDPKSKKRWLILKPLTNITE